MKKFLTFTQNTCLSALLISICTTIFVVYSFDIAYSRPANVPIIIDDDEPTLPKLALCTDTPEIVEGQVAVFDVGYHETSSNRIETDFPVFVKVTQIGEFFHGAPPSEVIIPKFLSGWSFEVETNDDKIDELDGRISASIVPNEGYEIVTSTSCNSIAHVTVKDNDHTEGTSPTPEISIYNFGPEKTFQGGVVNLKINSTGGIPTELPISILVSSSNNHMMDKPRTISVVLPAWTTEFAFNYQTVYTKTNDESPSDDSATLTFEIQPSDRYQIAESPHNFADIYVIHHDFTPNVSITAQEDSIYEGEQAVFRLGMYDNNQNLIAISDELIVNLGITVNGLFTQDSLPNEVKFASGKSHIEFPINTIDDRIYEANGKISINIKPGNGYSSTTILPTFAEIQILDNDTPIGGASILSNQIILTEGDTAYFDIIVPYASDKDRKIYYDVRTELFTLPKGSAKKSQTFNQFVLLPANETKTTLSYQTVDDEEDNEIGLLTVHLRPDKSTQPTYEIAKSRTWASVEYVDNDGIVPTVRLETSHSEVQDGGIVRFDLIANPPPDADNPLVINTLEITDFETGNPYPSYLIPNLIEFDQEGVGAGLVMLDPYFENLTNKKVVITLKDDLLNNYKAATAPDNTLVIDVKPNNVFSLAIENYKDEFVEGDTISLIVSVDKAYEDSFEVPVLISNPMNFSLWRAPKSVNFPIGVDKQTIHLKINHDNILQADGYISISLEGDMHRRYILDASTNLKIKIANSSSSDAIMEGARVSVAAQVAKSTLIQNGEFLQTSPMFSSELTHSELHLPIITIDSVVAMINEGESAEFRILQSKSVDHSVKIKLDTTESRNFLTDQLINSIEISPNQVEKFLVIQTLDDDLANKDGVLTVTILPDKSYTLGENYYAMVKISDKSDRDSFREELVATQDIINPVVLSSMESELLNATRESPIIQRKTNERFNYQILGQSSVKEILNAGKQLKDFNLPIWKGLLYGSSLGFDFYPVGETEKSLLFWGQGIHSNLSNFGIDRTNSWYGEVLTGLFGIDSILSPSISTGVSMSQTSVNAFLDWTAHEKQTQFTSNWIGFHPFLSWYSPLSGNNLHIISGYRWGQTRINQESDEAESTNSVAISTSLDGKLQIYSKNFAQNEVASELNVIGDGMFLYQSNDNYNTFTSHNQFINSRIALESTNWFNLENGVIIQPYLQFGLDLNMDHSKFYGAWDLTSGVDYIASPNLSVHTKSHVLISDLNQIRDYMFAGSLNFDKNLDNHGFRLKVSARNLLTFEENLMPLQFNNSANISDVRKKNWNFNSEIGYGFKLNDQLGIFDSYSNYSTTNQRDHTLRMGGRVSIHSNVNLDASVIRNFNLDLRDSSEIRFNGKINW